MAATSHVAPQEETLLFTTNWMISSVSQIDKASRNTSRTSSRDISTRDSDHSACVSEAPAELQNDSSCHELSTTSSSSPFDKFVQDTLDTMKRTSNEFRSQVTPSSTCSTEAPADLQDESFRQHECGSEGIEEWSSVNTSWQGLNICSHADRHAALSKLPGIVHIRNRLGVGRFSHMYQCSIEGRSEEVAVKLIQRPRASEPNREAGLLMQLSHPNLVQLLDSIQVENLQALVLEMCTGGSLMGLLHGSNAAMVLRFNLFRRLKSMIGIVSAIEYLHAKNIIHRDIKSSNCFLTEKVDAETQDLPVMKLGDLGLARPITKESMTRGTGTVRYMAPEVIASNTYGTPADVFSLATLLNELVTGEAPFCSLKCNDEVLGAAIKQGHRPSLQAMPQSAIRVDLPNILETCWAADANSRLTAIELLHFLTSVVDWIPEEEASYIESTIP